MMGVGEGEIIKRRLVYEPEMGVDSWMITQSNDLFGEVAMAQGKSGIEGVTSSVNTITTLKIGDVHTSGARDSLLQLLVYSKDKQSVVFEVTTKEEDGYVVYTHERALPSYGEWCKVTLSASEFKSERGPMESWADAIKFTISSERTLLINSLLWI